MLCAALSMLCACEDRHAGAIAAIDGQAMGTRYHIRIGIDDAAVAPATTALHMQIDAIFARIDQQMSAYRSDSELSRFNASTSTGWFPVSIELVTVIREAHRISGLSEGAFDVTVAPVVDLWGFGPDFRKQHVPPRAAIEEALALVDYRRLHYRTYPPSLRKEHPAIRVDLNAVAPGYAVDVVAAHLDGANLDSYLVELGGEVYARGVRPDGRGWKIGLEQPGAARPVVQTSLELRDKGLSTSGTYRNYFETDGARYSHTIDPRSGWPIRHDTVAVSVVAPTTAAADALATAMLVMGEDAGMRFAAAHELAARFVTRSRTEIRTLETPAYSALSSDGSRQP